MPTNKELEERTRKIENDISRAKGIAAVLGALAVAILWPLISSVLGALHSTEAELKAQSSSISALRQAFADQGHPTIAQIESSGAAKSIAQINTAIQTSIQSRSPLDVTQTQAAKTSVATVVRDAPSTPGLWNVASELISYQPGKGIFLQTTNLGRCVDRPFDFNSAASGALLQIPKAIIELITLHDCTLDLDDVLAFNESPPGARLINDRSSRPNVSFALRLERVTVVYKGGTPIPADFIVFDNCTFRFKVEHLPDSMAGRKLLAGLLGTNNLTVATIPLTS